MKRNDAAWREEQQRLDEVMGEIDRQMEKGRADNQKSNRETVQTRKIMWEDYARYIYDLEDAIEIKPQLDEMRRQERRELFYRDIFRKLERLAESPYFARIDLKEAGSEVREKIYIGVASLLDSGHIENLIYDWRAPIASLYYDAEIGKVAYQSPEGQVDGVMTLKRQFKVVGNQIEYFFDNGLKIDDEMLRRMLSQNADLRMRTIITTIQKEQNQAIRDETTQLLIVSGPAGSGKTSIALHRAAYLLYKMRDKIRAEHILIFSPNQIFSEYISNVLPALGEENIMQTTFHEYIKSFLGGKYQLEDRHQQLEYLYTGNQPEEYRIRSKNIRWKSSVEFIRLLDHYVKQLEQREFFDIIHNGKLIFSKAEAGQLFQKSLIYLPIGKRLQQIKRRFLYLLEPLRRERVKEIETGLAAAGEPLLPREIKLQARIGANREFETVSAMVDRMLEIDAYQCYSELFDNDWLFQKAAENIKLPPMIESIRRQTKATLLAGRLNFEDIIPLLYLQGLIFGFPALSNIKHLIIDEAQDYTVLQYRLLHHLFPNAGVTVLGDLNQSVHPWAKLESFTLIGPEFPGLVKRQVNLTQSYRSTDAINRFAAALLSEPESLPRVSVRSGAKPQIFKLNQPEQGIDCFIKVIRDLQAAGMESIALICKTVKAGIFLFQELSHILPIQLIRDENDSFTDKVLILPLYLAKGLEFDAVIVDGTNPNDCYRETERTLLYTACTRALHRLVLICEGESVRLFATVDSELYEEGRVF
jgi:DNA helicase-2/ATP-dependent DNA helicase PcrA